MRKLFYLLCLMTAACDGNSGNSEEVKFDEAIIGSWTSSCLETDSGDYIKSNYIFLVGTFDNSYSFYDDSECVNEIEPDESAWLGSFGDYEIREEVITTNGVRATLLELSSFGKGYEDLGVLQVTVPFFIDGDILYTGNESDGEYSIYFHFPHYLDD